jgi:hypothetical protein
MLQSQSHLLEIAPGADIMEEVATFVGRHQHSMIVSMLSGDGVITNPTLRQETSDDVVTLNGPFEIYSMSGIFFSPPGSVKLSVYDEGQCRLISGTVVGKLVAAGPVVVKMSTMYYTSDELLPAAGDEPAEEAAVAKPAGSDGMLLPEVSPPGLHQTVFVHDVPPNWMNNTGQIAIKPLHISVLSSIR